MRTMRKRKGAGLLPAFTAAADLYGLFALSAVLVAVVGILDPAWLTLGTLVTALEQNAPLAVVSVAMTFAVIAGMIDLSPGAMIALVGVVIGLANNALHNLALAILVGTAVALLVGVAHGLLVVTMGINSVIVTLAAYVWARGLATGLPGANSVPITGPFVTAMDTASVGGVSPPIAIVAAAFAGGWYLLSRTRFGLYTFAIGGDVQSARRAGIDTARQVLLIFALMGLAIAVGAVISVSQTASAQPLAATGLELDAIIAVIVGGARPAGGEGSILKTLAGVAFVAILNNGLSSLGLSDAYYGLLKGAVILVALSIQTLARRMTARDAARARLRAATGEQRDVAVA